MLDFVQKPATRKRSSTDMVIGTTGGEPLVRVPAEAVERALYLWTRLQVHQRELPRSVGITAYLGGEGVSFTARALAVALAEVRHTCILEANWWGDGLLPTVEPPGVAGLLDGTATLDDVVVGTNFPGLSILPAGPLAGVGHGVGGPEQRMRSLLSSLQHRFDHVILDLPALTSSPLALVFAGAAEASLLVVRQRVSNTDNVCNAIEDLRHANFLGVVLNGNQSSIPTSLRRRLLDS